MRLVESLLASMTTFGVGLRNSLVINLCRMRSTLTCFQLGSIFFTLGILELLSWIDASLCARRLLRCILSIKILSVI